MLSAFPASPALLESIRNCPWCCPAPALHATLVPSGFRARATKQRSHYGSGGLLCLLTA